MNIPIATQVHVLNLCDTQLNLNYYVKSCVMFWNFTNWKLLSKSFFKFCSVRFIRS